MVFAVAAPPCGGFWTPQPVLAQFAPELAGDPKGLLFQPAPAALAACAAQCVSFMVVPVTTAVVGHADFMGYVPVCAGAQPFASDCLPPAACMLAGGAPASGLDFRAVEAVRGAGGQQQAKPEEGPAPAPEGLSQRPAAKQPEAGRHHAAGGSASDVGLATDLMAQLNGGEEAFAVAIHRLSRPDMVRRLSFEPAGCRAVQLALDLADRRTAADLAAGLHGHVEEAVCSPHANYVVQKIIKVLTPQEIPFVLEELCKANLSLACHEYGCRVYCRLLEHTATNERTAQLMDELLLDAEELVKHIYGHHVVECALEHGLPQQRQQIIAALRKNLLHNAWNRTAAYVVEKALLYGSEQDREALGADLSACSRSELVALARNQYGSMVIRAALRVPGPPSLRLRQHLSTDEARAQLRTTKHGRRLLNNYELGSTS